MFFYFLRFMNLLNDEYSYSAKKNGQCFEHVN
jgi:hypothetical protein